MQYVGIKMYSIPVKILLNANSVINNSVKQSRYVWLLCHLHLYQHISYTCKYSFHRLNIKMFKDISKRSYYRYILFATESLADTGVQPWTCKVTPFFLLQTQEKPTSYTTTPRVLTWSHLEQTTPRSITTKQWTVSLSVNYLLLLHIQANPPISLRFSQCVGYYCSPLSANSMGWGWPLWWSLIFCFFSSVTDSVLILPSPPSIFTPQLSFLTPSNPTNLSPRIYILPSVTLIYLLSVSALITAIPFHLFLPTLL